MDCKLMLTNRAITDLHRKAGVTLAEFLIAIAIVGVVLGQVCLLWLYSSRSFAAQMAYADMDQKSQRTLDIITQNLRQCKALTNFAPTRITLLDYDNRPLTFSFENGELKRTKDNVTKTLLRECKAGQFAIYQRTPVNGTLESYPTTDPNLCKLVEVRWTCARKLFPTAPNTTETMQSARIVLRVK